MWLSVCSEIAPRPPGPLEQMHGKHVSDGPGCLASVVLGGRSDGAVDLSTRNVGRDRSPPSRTHGRRRRHGTMTTTPASCLPILDTLFLRRRRQRHPLLQKLEIHAVQ